MALPAQVQAALEAADATLAEANASNAPSVPDVFSEPIDPGTTAPAQPAPPPEPVVVEQTPAPAKVHDEWEARYKTLQGLFNKTVPELQGQVKELQGSLSEAVQRLNRASSEKEDAAATVADPKDVDNFGSDLVDMVNRVATAATGGTARMLEAKTAALVARIAEMAEQLKGTSSQIAVTAEQTFFDKLSRILPDWEQTNANENFRAWLAEADPIYGVPRQQALSNAQRQLDVERVAAVFNAFTGPRKAAAPATDPLERMVSPRGAATVAPTPTDKPMITQGQITKFYDDVNKGRYRGNETEMTRIEAMINAALSEGRIR